MFKRREYLFFAFLFCGILTQPLSLNTHANAGTKQSVSAGDLSGQLEGQLEEQLGEQLEEQLGEQLEERFDRNGSEVETILIHSASDIEVLKGEEDDKSEPAVQETAQAQKIMYLTFDDGPSKEDTETILDILKERNVKATFFLIGENVERYPEVARRIAEEGHTIGIHCYSHEYKKIYADAASYLADFEKARQVVYETTGVEAKLFRFPGGSINSYNKGVYKAIIQEMTEKGYIYFDWNASLEDATKHNAPERLLENAKTSTLDRQKVVMLAHDRVHNTALCLEDLIDQFPEYQMLPLTEDVKPVQF